MRETTFDVRSARNAAAIAEQRLCFVAAGLLERPGKYLESLSNLNENAIAYLGAADNRVAGHQREHVLDGLPRPGRA